MRQNFTKSTKLARFEHAKGCCEDCGQRIVGVAEYDHAIADYIGGTSTFENCRCLCKKCHDRKTAVDRPKIDKTRRIAEKRAGVRKSKLGFRKPPAGYDTFNRQWRDE